jgi:hypothetical protein
MSVAEDRHSGNHFPSLARLNTCPPGQPAIASAEDPVSRQLATFLAASVVFITAGCVAGTPPVPSASPVPAPSIRPVAVPPASPAVQTPRPDEGNVDKVRYPELTVEPRGSDSIQVTLEDPHAKAWRLVVAGTLALADDRLELLVETGDVSPSISATEVQVGRTVDVMDLSGYADGTATAGGCHRTLPVCIDSGGFRLPSQGDGILRVRLTITDPAASLTVTGGTATWPGEPFILGPWTDTEPFPWSQG